MDMSLWFSNLLFWSVQAALLVLSAAFLARVLQLSQPRVLVAYWRLLLGVSLLLPLLQPWHRAQNVAAVVISGDLAGVPLLQSSPAPAHWHLPSLQTLAPIAGLVILAGIALRFALLVLGLLKLRRLRQASQPIDATAESTRVLHAVRILLATPAEFRFSAQVGSPVTFGFFAPVVLLPERFASLDPRFQSAIACHELLHVRRRDWAHHLAEEALRAVFWFHPAIAWLISRMRLAREQVVDLEVVRLTNARKSYLEALLEFTNARTGFAAIPAPPFLAERQLVERVSLMLKEVRMSQRRLIVSLALISSCLALVTALAAWTFPLKAAPRPAQLVPQDASSQQQKSTTAPVPGFQRVLVNYHDFDDAPPTHAAVNAVQVKLSRLLDVGSVYDQAKVDTMKKVLEDFWSERGVTVAVRAGIAPDPPSASYATLEFDVYNQKVLPGKLEGGVPGGVPSGIAGGIADSGVRGGVSGGISTHASADEPSVDISTIWVDTVKRGAMPIQVRGQGTLVREEGSENLVARVNVPAAADLKSGQYATVGSMTKNGIGKGHIISIGPQSNDTRTLDIALDTTPQGFSAGLEVIATFTVGKLDNVLFVGRPVNGAANSSINLFKISSDGSEAVRTQVKLGRASVNTIEILDGLQDGDKVILTDTSSVANAERIRLTDEKHLLHRSGPVAE